MKPGKARLMLSAPAATCLPLPTRRPLSSGERPLSQLVRLCPLNRSLPKDSRLLSLRPDPSLSSPTRRKRLCLTPRRARHCRLGSSLSASLRPVQASAATLTPLPPFHTVPAGSRSWHPCFIHLPRSLVAGVVVESKKRGRAAGKERGGSVHGPRPGPGRRPRVRGARHPGRARVARSQHGPGEPRCSGRFWCIPSFRSHI
jgi:hypothetical protein